MQKRRRRDRKDYRRRNGIPEDPTERRLCSRLGPVEWCLFKEISEVFRQADAKRWATMKSSLLGSPSFDEK